ncbi:hypothetical protein RFF05_04020 [Bengtsoniella intestinalis]|uniref:hypothetical protein n=1 Tax=Bengtsoniella intestinalis TaxID=3073143 RepID=UPI00391F1F4D
MAAISGAMIAKVATQVLSNEKLRNTAGWIAVAIFSPLILVAVIICGLLSGTSDHNQTTVDYCFYGGTTSTSTPTEYQSHIDAIQDSFTVIDLAVAKVNGLISGDDGLDNTQVKSVFYTLYFGTDELPGDEELEEFVDSFVEYEEVVNTIVNADGTTSEESYIIAKLLDMSDVYENFSTVITLAQQESINTIYAQVTSAGDSFSGDFQYGTGGSTVIDISGFTDTTTKNNLDLAAYAQQAWSNQWGYVWGTCGWILTPSMLASKVIQYPDGVGTYQDFISENWLNGRTTDCVGLIKGYGWLDCDTLEIGYATNGMPDIGADQMYAVATVKGSISTMPETVGLAVWKDGHIGVYIGNGYVIEAMSTQYGVVKTKLSDRSWTAWLEVPYINYIDTEESEV